MPIIRLYKYPMKLSFFPTTDEPVDFSDDAVERAIFFEANMMK